MGRKLVTYDEARPAKKQHKKPCSDCPWARTAMPGWLGGLTSEQWLRVAHGDGQIVCHTRQKMQCAGAAIFRANVCKSPRDPEALELPADRERVFARNQEFTDHHEDGGKP